MTFPFASATLPVPALINHLWQSTAVTAIVWGLCFALRRNRAGLRFRLWLLASVKFLLPFALLITAGEHLRSTSTTAASAPALTRLVTHAVQPYDVAPLSSALTRHTPSEKGPWQVRALEGCALLWLTGAIAVLSSWCLTWSSVRRIATQAAPWGTVAGIPVRTTRKLLEPGVFGVFRPVLLMPEELPVRLPPEQLEAIFAHELCHVRRRDNLFAVLHTVVLALFWFHPAVWLIRARLLDERERACDESVVGEGGDPALYAESILNVCKLYVEAPATAMAGVTGGELKQRVIRILTQTASLQLSRTFRVVLAIAAMLILSLPVTAGFATAHQVHAQAQESTGIGTPQSSPSDAATQALPSFEVSSIRPSKPAAESMSWGPAGTQWEATNATLSFLLTGAFQVRGYQLTNLPGWVRNEHYDIHARIPDAIVHMPEQQRIKQYNLLMQSMLSNRFGLRYHWTTQPHVVYTLVVDKGGPRMSRPKQGSPVGWGISDHIYADAITMDDFAELLGGNMDEIVQNQTGLTGQFAFVLRYPPPDGAPESEKHTELSNPETQARLLPALQDQLGLKLVAEKRPVPMLVIDDIQRPTPN